MTTEKSLTQSPKTDVSSKIQPAQVAVCWLDVLLLVLFVFLGMLLWNLADRFINWSHRHLEPVKEKYEHASQLPLRQAELATAQEELKSFQAKLLEQKLESVRIAAELAAMKNSTPGTKKLDTVRRELGTKLDAATAMVSRLEIDLPTKLRQIAGATGAVVDSRRTAELNFFTAQDRFQFEKKIKVLGVGVLSWTFLFVFGWFLSGVLQRIVGRGRRSFIFVPAFAFLLIVCMYHFLK